MDVRSLDASEIDAAIGTLAIAFDDDPLFRFFLPGASKRASWLRWFHALSIRQALAAGGAFTVARGPDVGVMAVLPPGRFPTPFRDILRAARLPTRLPTIRLLASGLPLLRALEAAHPNEDHFYLFAIGVHPTHKGKGLGGAMLRHLCALADAAHASAHLETANPANIGLYQRFGFRSTQEVVFGGAPPTWTMTRR